MSQPADSTLQSFLRLSVMVAALLVGGMAYHLYGPPLGETSALIDRMVQAASEAFSTASDSGSPQQGEQPATAPAYQNNTLQPLPTAGHIDDRVRPATAMAQLAPMPARLPPLESAAQQPAGQTPATAALMEQLKSLGAAGLSLSPWGSEGVMHRFECTVAVPGDAGFVRHFDAIESDPYSAVAKVAQRVHHWRTKTAGPSATPFRP